ncbi:uncharacterized protein FFB20_12468 [Fusarium fujikuroi]|nr:uncharacterized protein FFB20_12468 [Fusarium fujikuroi]
MALVEPDTESLRSKALVLARKISEAWFAVVASDGKTDLQELRFLLATNNGWLSDLEEEVKAIREDKTICRDEAQNEGKAAERHDSNDANPERQSFLTAPTAVPDRDDYLQSAQDHRRDRNHEQDRPIEARKVRPVLVLNSLEVRLAKEERSVEIESRQADLAIRVAQGDVSVCDVA